MDEEHHWWYCVRHNRVEADETCPGKDRLGPFDSEADAARALETVRERNKEWDAGDE